MSIRMLTPSPHTGLTISMIKENLPNGKWETFPSGGFNP
jgi:hypothetical protein